MEGNKDPVKELAKNQLEKVSEGELSWAVSWEPRGEGTKQP